MKIEIKEKLRDIEYEGNEKTQELKQKVEEFLFNELGQKYNILFSDGEEDYKVNEIKEGSNYGFAFGISKFDEGFMERHDDLTFRYKDTEVKKVLKKLIEEFGLAPRIEWGRGMGVFVFNIFLK